MTKDEALKLALEALEQTLQTLDDENAKPGGAIADTIWHSEHETLFDYLGSEITALKEALAQPEQEPVALSCCGYTDASAVKWNPFNRIVQCHNCGQTYTPPQRTEPTCPECKAEVLYECVACSSNNYPPKD